MYSLVFAKQSFASVYKIIFTQAPVASGVEVMHVLETAKACGSNPTGIHFCKFFASLVLSRTISRLLIFIGSILARFFLKVQLSSKML